jgi:oligopeptide/dipeptide ABC transporter ATP-binding protein
MPRHAAARVFFRSPSAVIGLSILAVVAFFAAFGPTLFGHAATNQDFSQLREPPGWPHLLGTDDVGRDILARILYATRLTLGIALAASGVAFVVGVTLGSVAAVLRTRSRSVVLRAVDTMISFPSILKALLIGTIIGVGTDSVILGIGIAGSFGFARTTSTLALSVGGREYVNAARVVGARGHRLVFRHLLPNIAEPLIVFLGVSVAFSILGAAGLSFLGVGTQPPAVDWGQMLTDGVKQIYIRPAAALGPAVAIALTALAFGYVAEALARAMNPQLWTTGDVEGRRHAEQTVVESQAAPATSVPHPATARNGVVGGAGAPEPDRSASDGAVLGVRDLVVSFPTAVGPVEVVKGISFSVARGERVAIVGESGSGKTMTALAIAQLIAHPGIVDGTIELAGEDVRTMSSSRRRTVLGTDVAVVFQDPTSSLNPALSIGRQMTEGVRTHRRLGPGAAKQLALARMAEVHLPSPIRQLKRYPHELSGGMRQRVMIAMGLMNEPALLLCDEPTTALDVTIQAQIMDLLEEVNHAHGTAILLISHNLALVRQHCDRVIVMYAGRIVEELTTERLVLSPQHPYTRALVAAIPDLAHPRDRPLTAVAGEPADVASPPSGCAFHPRCPLAVDRCRTERPELLPSGDGADGRVACHVAAKADVVAGRV